MWTATKMAHQPFACDGCGLRFCDEHKIGDNLCLGCAMTGAELEAEEHAVFGPCTCRQTDADIFDPRGCESHDSESLWNVRLRALTAVQQYEQNQQERKTMGWLNGKDTTARASVLAPAPAAADSGGLVVPNRSNGSNPFAKAVKYAAKGRTALVGPAGSGKSFTMLMLARALAGPTGKIAAIDTEHGSLSKYADVFDFDVLELGSFTPESFITTLHAARRQPLRRLLL
jgi:hypothetical protein